MKTYNICSVTPKIISYEKTHVNMHNGTISFHREGSPSREQMMAECKTAFNNPDAQVFHIVDRNKNYWTGETYAATMEPIIADAKNSKALNNILLSVKRIFSKFIRK